MSLISKLPAARKYEISGVLMLSGTLLIFLALASDGYLGTSQRPFIPWTSLGEVPNGLGVPGAFVAGFLYILLGHAAHIIYVLTCIWGAMLMIHRPVDRLVTRFIGSFLLLVSLAGLLHINLAQPGTASMPGGTLGAFVASLIQPTFGPIGANIFAVTLSTVGILLATDFLFVHILRWSLTATLLAIRVLTRAARGMKRAVDGIRAYQKMRSTKRKQALLELHVIGNEAVPKKRFSRKMRRRESNRIRVKSAAQNTPFDEIPDVEVIKESPIKSVRLSHKTKTSKSPGVQMTIGETPANYNYPAKYTLPPMDLLEHPDTVTHAVNEDDLREMGLVLEEALLTFGVEARVTDVTRGPTITRFEVEPAPGIKVNRFVALADDLALALKAHRVRVEAPIPGRGKVGIEVPNETREPVVIRELIESENFNTNAYSLALAMGKEIAGNVATADLAAMPHLLVAGATGSGKTVYVKTILASLLFTKTPDELQLILIDPKMVELSIFNDIPHLITPVVIDPKKAASSLNWLINEMEERYRLFAHLRVRNIDVYNDSVKNGEIAVTEPEENDTQSYAAIRTLPYIVCIIDELADLMMLARAEVEDAIARLAQLARAVGIHLVIATQRPSVDVLTGVIKANFPSRISFQVSSRVDSRCILDEIGAERLIGHGDMLYLPPGQSKPTRLQGAFISDREMDNLIAYLKTQAPPQYRDEIEQFGKQKDSLIDLADDTDDLFDNAVRVVTETGQASISMVQRRLRVGYTRAARLIDMMELRGIVGPHVGSKAREILIPVPGKDDEVA